MAHRNRVRRTTVGIGALLLCAPLVTACGAKATSRPYTPAAGVDVNSPEVDVLNAVIVAAEDGTGNLVATLANKSPDEPATLTGITSTGSPVAQVEPSEIEVPAAAAINLADLGGIPATGDYEQGQFVPLSFTFDTDQGVVSLDTQVVVVLDDGDWAGLGIPGDSGTGSDVGEVTTEDTEETS